MNINRYLFVSLMRRKYNNDRYIARTQIQRIRSWSINMSKWLSFIRIDIIYKLKLSLTYIPIIKGKVLTTLIKVEPHYNSKT